MRIKKNAVRNEQQWYAEGISGLRRNTLPSLHHINSLVPPYLLALFYFRSWLLYFHSPHVTRYGERS